MSSEVSSPAVKPWRRLMRTALGSSAYAALALIGAGRLDWGRGWLYAAVFVAASVVGTAVVLRADPAVLAARAKGFRGDTEPFDRLFYALFLPLIAGMPIVAGLDAGRFGWAPLPDWTALPGILLFVAGSALSTWALLVNTHAESTVRIQRDRAHAVVQSGPYRFVRHPMYLGTLIGLPAAALMLGSAWALLPAALIIALFVWRSAREDEALHRELPGYADYAAATRFRLLPGLW
ncbi:methyltransferase family protein [Rhodopseudomonas palustris]|uniref:Isoprenylcysteine carboxylmethyltransferase family protein n=1 Tax=Rhodopseudomonas palustris TaxID=1076 RepID=A0A418UZH1_RHOPL|nr:isoprenylcysteine carboxylmethyltransferase family protein [Rhodopseudomonas palustris]RJF68748.1 isoprenylcysteine carboxylmethyltransferase family protein [Rhodopseudomonas palustris]